jgi:hypothetical protein
LFIAKFTKADNAPFQCQGKVNAGIKDAGFSGVRISEISKSDFGSSLRINSKVLDFIHL